jgi:hypothetical protein
MHAEAHLLSSEEGRTVQRVLAMMAAALSLAGCETAATIWDKKNLAFAMQPAQMLVDRLGQPNDAKVIKGEKTYFWNSYGCTFRATVDAEERITGMGYQGPDEYCITYVRRL